MSPCHVVILQETYNTNRLNDRYLDVQFFAQWSNESRGIAIVFKAGINFKIENILKNKDGWNIFIEGERDDKTLTLASMYAPNQGQIGLL